MTIRINAIAGCAAGALLAAIVSTFAVAVPRTTGTPLSPWPWPGPSAAAAQSVLDRGPNLSDGWVGAPNSVHFNFLHRFNQSGPPRRQVTNRPTFEMAYRTRVPLLIGIRHATRSDVVPGIPNEWEPFARYAVLQQDLGSPVDASVHAAWNAAARSLDGEVTAARRYGPVRVIAGARVLGSAFDSGDTRFALAGGGSVRLTRWVAIAGDYAQLLDLDDDERGAWGVALQFAVPYTPHSVSLQATNTNTATIHGASRGEDQVRWGFEFTVPVAVARYIGPRATAAAPPPPPPPAPAADLDSLRVAIADSVRMVIADSVARALTTEFELRLVLDAEQRAAREDSIRIAREAAARADSVRRAAAQLQARRDAQRTEAERAETERAEAAARAARAVRPTVSATIRNLAYAPARIEVSAGTTITWRNEDQMDHTVTALDGLWDSGVIRPGQMWQRTFDTPGTYEFICTPHPFMRGTVIVRAEP